jgi:hypothetical protein
MEEITLENVIDRGLANRGYIKRGDTPKIGAWHKRFFGFHIGGW